MSQLRSATLPAGDLPTTNYVYDAIYQLTQATQAATTTENYTYDGVGNRLSRTESTPGKGNQIKQSVSNYTYDAIYQLTQGVLNGATSETYSYDAVGNRLSSRGVSPYTYNSSNELTSKPLTPYSYDNDGNTVGKSDQGAIFRYRWDFENRLTSVSLPNGSVLQYKYDPFGRRIFSDGTGRIFVYDGGNVPDRS